MRRTSIFFKHLKKQTRLALSHSPKTVQAKLVALIIFAMLVFGGAKLISIRAAAFQCVSFTTMGAAIAQNFDTLSNTAGSTMNNLTITGWFMTESGGGARDNDQYGVDTGASNTGDTYSYGAAAATERAMGGLRSGTLIPVFGSCFTNNTGQTITSLAVAYTGEEWRLGTAGRTDQLNFEYSTNATDLTTGTWTNVAALNFVTPDTTTTGAKNGNAAADRTAISSTITGLSIPNGATFWIRWTDFDASGADDGLAVDDFSITPFGAVVQPNLTINDVSLNEGNAGTTTFTYTVSLSAPAGVGGVAFDIATADNTATQPGDYTQKSLAIQIIPEGSSTYSFSVLVNGDTTPETNETFFVNVTNVTGANVTDGQGQGTIVNDDAAPNLTINDVSLNEGNSGTTTFTFTASLSAPAPAGGVTFDIATADNTATQPGDYTAKSLTSQTIPAGSSTYTFDVLVNGDSTPESNETFFVNITNLTNAIPTDVQGQGTIVNEDFTRIHDIQGSGTSSPLVGQSVTTQGIVTGLKSNGFFFQEPDASVDGNPATSEGIFVFTSSAPPAAAAIGNLVQVTATVVEFVPSTDTQQPPLSELSSPTVTLVSAGNPLPAAIPLTATFPDPTGAFDQLERVEGMRVSMTSMTVGGPTLGNVNEPNATATSSGVFFGTVTGITRAFREAGIQHPDTPPSGTIPPIPRFDTNPEVIRVDSDGLVGGSQINVSTTTVVNNLVGPLDYGFRHYTILPDPASPPTSSGGMTATAVATPLSDEVTIASYNIERFFDTVADGNGAPTLTTTAFNNRLAKASLHIRDYLKTPDIVGIVEIENLTTLQALATKINNDAVANSQPNPLYTAYLIEGNDVGGIDVGFLVKTAIVTGSTPRVTVNGGVAIQELDASVFTNPNASTETLHDRPPLRLDATVNFASGATFPVQVIINHLRSLNGVSDTTAGSNGWATDGERVRAKRLAQVVDLANLVQTRQTNNPNERIILLGDFNFFEVNDGYGDSMSTLLGAPVPDNQTVVTGDGIDLVTPDLTLLLDSLLQRYSFVFDGNAQSLDHAIVNAALITATSARRIEHPRVNGDFPETDRNGTTTRLADHDPLVVYLQIPNTADLSITKTDLPDPVTAGNNLTYTITASNSGPDAAASVSWSDTLPAATTFQSLSAPGGWSCTTPAVGSGGTVTCSIASLASSGSGVFTLVVQVSAGVANGAVLSNTATITSSTTDSNSSNNSATATTTVNASADLSITKTDGATTEIPGTTVTYTIVASNSGPSNVSSATVADMLPATLTGATWTCVGAGGGSCTAAGSGNINDTVNLPSGGSVTYTVSATISASATGTLSNTATVGSSVTDPNSANNSDTDSDTLTPQADLAIAKTDGVTSAVPGQSVTYTITASNAGTSDAPGSTVTDTFPPTLTGVTWTCVGAGGGTCTAAGSGNISDTVNLPSGGSVTYTATGTISASATGMLVNTAVVLAGGGVVDPTPGNNSATDTDTLIPTANLGITKTDGVTSIAAGSSVTYTIVASNAGLSDAPGSAVTDTFPATITGVTWTCVGAGGGTCPANGSGNINATVNLPAGGSVTFTANGTLSNAATGTLVNTVTVAAAGGVIDPTPGNNTATDTDTITTGCTITCPTNQSTWTSGTSATVNYPAPTADASCGTVTCTPASGSTFNVGTTTVNCSTNAGPSCSFTVTVNQLALGTVGLADPLACNAPGDKVNGNFSATNSTGAAATVSLTATLTNLVTLPNMASADVAGTVTLTATTVNWTGTLNPGQTVTVNWMGQLADTLPAGTQACSTVTATANGQPVAGQAQACAVINCPAPGAGLPFPANAEGSDQGAGSVLIYNVYTSGATSGNAQNTRINITNSHPTRTAFVHLFFVAEGCSVADSYLCLTGNQTASFLASDLDPGTTGYLVAIAVDGVFGCPTSHNYLIGDEYVKFSTGHAANLGAVAFSQLAGGLPACNGNSVTAQLNFDGVSYDRTPATLALDNVGSRADGNDTLLILNRIGGNLGTGAATLSALFGILYDDSENALSFSVSGNCQLRNSINNNFPRTTPRFESFIPAGRTGWLKVFNQTGAIGITGAAINVNANSVSSAGAFNQGHNLHALTLNNGMAYTIPVFPPSC